MEMLLVAVVDFVVVVAAAVGSAVAGVPQRAKRKLKIHRQDVCDVLENF